MSQIECEVSWGPSIEEARAREAPASQPWAEEAGAEEDQLWAWWLGWGVSLGKSVSITYQQCQPGR